MNEHAFCPTCQASGCMKVGGVGPPVSFDMDMYGMIGYECRYCGTRGWGPGSSPWLITTYEPRSICIVLDGNAYCAKRLPFVNLQEGIAGFGDTRLAAVKDMLKQESDPASQLKEPRNG